MKRLALAFLFLHSSAALALTEGSKQFVELVASIDPALIAGTRIPKWDDFAALAVLGQSVSQNKAELVSEQAEVSQLLQADPRVGVLLNAALKSSRETQFSATEYELKLQYTYMVSDVNAQLPPSLRIPFRRIAFDQRRKVVNENGRKLVRQLEPKFEAVFNQREISEDEKKLDHGGSGGTLSEVIERIRSSSDPLIQKAKQVLAQGDVRPAIRRPESARFWIPKVGFHNQYITKTSRGMNNNDARRRYEASLLGDLDPLIIQSTDPETLPKYGTLLPDPESELANSAYGSYQYGDDIYFLKVGNIEDRLSFTMDDSLSVIRSDVPWQKLFVPWKFKDLMLPLLAGGIERKDAATPVGSVWFFDSSRMQYSRYWEIQIFGSLRLSDVDSLQFLSSPPRGRYLLELLKNDIKIYDGRQSPPKPWLPSAEEIQAARASGAP